jgi:hypothetical protein
LALILPLFIDCVLKFFPSKFLSCFAVLAFASLGVHSQVKIGVNLGPPDPSAVLEVESTQGGLLLPRLTTIQRNAIANPAAGLVIFNLDTHCENFFNGQSWRQLCGTCDFPDPQPVISGNFCLGDTLTLSTPQVGQNAVYQWTGPNGFSAQGQSVSVVLSSNSASGNYSVATTMNNCTSNAMSVSVQVNALPQVILDSLNDVKCNGQTNGAIYLSFSQGQAPYQVLWSNGDTNRVYTGRAAGIYSAQITDALGCTASFTDTIHQPNVLQVASSSNSPVPYGQSLNLSASASGGTAPYTYQWSGPGGYTSNQASPVRSPNSQSGICFQANEGVSGVFSAGQGLFFSSIQFASYGTPNGSCPGYSTSGCHAQSSVAIVQSACLGQGSCLLNADNGIFGDPCVGQGKWLYVSATAQQNMAGTYSLTLTDSNGCQASSSAVVVH